MARVFWFRRDLRLQDNVALNQAINSAIAEGDARVAPVYALNIQDFKALEGIRQWSLVESLRSLQASLGGNLSVLQGEQAQSLVGAALK